MCYNNYMSTSYPRDPETYKRLIDKGFTTTDIKLHFDQEESASKILKEFGLVTKFTKNSSKKEVAEAALHDGVSDELRKDTYLIMVGALSQEEVRRKHEIPTNASAQAFSMIEPKYKKRVAGLNAKHSHDFSSQFDPSAVNNREPNELLKDMLKNSVSVSALARILEVSDQSISSYLSECDDLPEDVVVSCNDKEILKNTYDEVQAFMDKALAGELYYSDGPTYLVMTEHALRSAVKKHFKSNAEYRDFVSKASQKQRRETNISRYGAENVWSGESSVTEKMLEKKRNTRRPIEKIIDGPLQKWSEEYPSPELLNDLCFNNCFYLKDITSAFDVDVSVARERMGRKARRRLSDADREERYVALADRIKSKASAEDLTFDISNLALEIISRKYAIPSSAVKSVLSKVVSDYDVLRNAYCSLSASSSSPLNRIGLDKLRNDAEFTKIYDYAYSKNEFSPSFDARVAYAITHREQDGLKPFLAGYKEIHGHPDVFPDSKVLDYLGVAITHATARSLEADGLISIDYDSLKESKFEKRVRELFTDLEVEFDVNRRDLLADSGKEVDFYVPEKKLAIEISPSSSHHSNEFASTSHFGRKPDKYHYQKYKDAESSNIQLIQLFDFDLVEPAWSQRTVPSLTNFIAGSGKRVYARDTIVEECSTSEAREFCDKYHRSGYANATAKFKLTHDSETVAVFTLQENKQGKPVELKRLAYKNGVQVIGGTSKIASHARRWCIDAGYSALSSFSDNAWGSGLSYEKAGFKFNGETGPSLRFINYLDGSDVLSWSVATPWSAKSGVIAADCKRKGIDFASLGISPREYVEIHLSHRTDSEEGYTALFTPGSKKWLMTF